ncbi:MAG: hypothetical protein ACJ796_09515 [Gemmatimonadaceae bacterium]
MPRRCSGTSHITLIAAGWSHSAARARIATRFM